MDDDLWGPPYYPATEDTMSFCLPYDVIEEQNELNEKSCIQVLEIWISKANTEIAEHEEELMELVSQLAGVDEVFSNMFSMTLKSKIDFLDSSVKKFKDDADDFFSTSREPAESIHDIVKSLFCHYLEKKDLQKCADETRTGLRSDYQVPADNQKTHIGNSSNANEMEKFTTVNITPVEKQAVSLTLVKVKEENTNYANPTAAPKYSPLSLCWSSTKKKDREEGKFQMKSKRPIIVTKEKDAVQNRTPRNNSIGPKPSLETQRKLKDRLNIINSQTVVDEDIGSAIVPYVESSDESNASSNLIANANENANEKQIVVKEQELDFPPGYPKQPLKNQSGSLSLSPYGTRKYTRKVRQTSPLQISSSSPYCSLAVAKPLAGPDRCRSLYIEDCYTVNGLRAIARERNLKGYYKLRKAELAQMLGIKLIEGRRKQQKKKETQSVVPMIKYEPDD